MPDLKAFVRASRFFFIPVVNKPVPFRVVEIEFAGTGLAYLSLEGVDTPEKAAFLCQQPLLAFKEELQAFYHRRQKPLSFTTGYRVISSDGVVVGEVEEVFFEGEKGFLVIPTNKHPLILPAEKTHLARIDHSRKVVKLSLSASQLSQITR